MVRPAILRKATALVIAIALPTEVGAQIVAAPKNNFDAAVNGMFSLCPVLAGGGAIPDTKASAPFGLKPISAPAGQHRFKSLFKDGGLQLWFEPAKRMCTVHYHGPGFRAIAGVARALPADNGFRPVKIEDPDAPRGDVLVRPSPGAAGREQYIIVEDSASQTASVAYFLKGGA
jgi:hypothetical protein